MNIYLLLIFLFVSLVRCCDAVGDSPIKLQAWALYRGVDPGGGGGGQTYRFAPPPQ